MDSLVPLHIDKSTGNIVAKNIRATVGLGFVHFQTTPALVWTIAHNTTNANIVCQIYDTSSEQIMPNKVTIVDPNTVQVEFNSPQDGRAHILVFTTL